MDKKNGRCYSCFPCFTGRTTSSHHVDHQTASSTQTSTISNVLASLPINSPSIPFSSQANPSPTVDDKVLEGVSCESLNTKADNLQPASSSSNVLPSSCNVPSAAAAFSSQPNPSPTVDEIPVASSPACSDLLIDSMDKKNGRCYSCFPCFTGRTTSSHHVDHQTASSTQTSTISNVPASLPINSPSIPFSSQANPSPTVDDKVLEGVSCKSLNTTADNLQPASSSSNVLPSSCNVPSAAAAFPSQPNPSPTVDEIPVASSPACSDLLIDSMDKKNGRCYSCFPCFTGRTTSSHHVDHQTASSTQTSTISNVPASLPINSPPIPFSSQANPSPTVDDKVLEGVSCKSLNTTADNLQPASSSSNVLPSSQPNPSPTVDDKILEEASSRSSNAGVPSTSCSSVTVPDLTNNILKDVENVDVDLDNFSKHISELLNALKKGESLKTSKPKESCKKREQTILSFGPTTSTGFSKLKDSVSVAIDSISSMFDDQKDLSSQTTTVVMDVVKGALNVIGQAHWATAGLFVVANILERFENVSKNRDDCLVLLNEMYILARYIKDIRKLAHLSKEMEDTINEGMQLLLEASVLCCTQINHTKLFRFFSTSVDRAELLDFQTKLQRMYGHNQTQMLLSIYNAINKGPKVRVPEPRERPYPTYAEGIEKQMLKVIELLEFKSEKNALGVMLHGFGGIGKTTLANAVYAVLDIKGFKYSKVTLFDDIKSTPNIVNLQKRVLNDLRTGAEEEGKQQIASIEEGQQQICGILEKQVAFIYIDNVLDGDRLELLFPRTMENAKRLRVLITARDSTVRTGCRMMTTAYPMELLDYTAGMTVFMKEMHSVTDDKEWQIDPTLLKDIIQSCGGIPKLLTVVARFIGCEEDKEKACHTVMEDRKKLKGQAFDKIDDYVFAYDGLPEECKDPFLDICSFFNMWEWDTVALIVGESVLDRLEKRALVTKGQAKDKAMTVNVHDVILTIGSQKAQGTRVKFIDEFTEVNGTKYDIEEFFEEGITGIKGFWFDSSYSSISSTKLDSMSDSLKILAPCTVEGKCIKRFKKLIFYEGQDPYLPFDLSELKQLTYFKHTPQNLDLLREMPTNVKHIELDGSLCSHVFSSDIQHLVNLRVLRLTEFKALKKLLGEWSCVSLKELTLSDCTSLEEITGSVSKLQHLKVLRLNGCLKLRWLGEDFGSLSSLQELDLSRCESIEELPKSISKLQSLVVLRLNGCLKLRWLGEDFGSLSSLQELDLSQCESIEELPKSISKLQSLEVLRLNGCLTLRWLGEDFGSLSSLQELDLSRCESIEELPKSISKLQSLVVLRLNGCLKLRWLGEDFGSLSSLQELDLSQCESIEELPKSISKLQSLKVLRLNGCLKLRWLGEDFGSLSSLQELDLSQCESIEELPKSISKLQSLEVLRLNGCLKLRWLGKDFGSLSSLQELDLSQCESIEELPKSISKLQSLKVLRLNDFKELKLWTEDFGSLSSLEDFQLPVLDLSNCSIVELPKSISKLQSLKELRLKGCSMLRQLTEDFGSLSSLQVLDLSNCASIEELPKSFSKLPSLEVLTMHCCTSLKRFPKDSESLISSLKVLDLSFCANLKELPSSFGKFLHSRQKVLLEKKGVQSDHHESDSDHLTEGDTDYESDRESLQCWELY